MLESEKSAVANGDSMNRGGDVKNRTYTIIDCFRTPNLRRISICTSLLW